MSRRTSFAILSALIAWLSALSAFAQTSTGGSTSTALAETDFGIYVETKNASGSWTELTTDEAKTFFDRARCDCGTTVRFVVRVASTSVETKISNLLADSGADGEARLYLAQSSGCTSDPTESSYGCVLLDQIDALDSLARTGYWTSTEVKITDLFSSDGTCDSLKTTYIWLWVDTASDGSADLVGDSAPSLSLRLDGKGPATPTGLLVQGGKEALILTWDSNSSSSSSTTDLAGFLVFCANSDGSAVFASSPYGSQFISPSTLIDDALCPDQETLEQASDPSGLASTLANLAPAYLCSGLIAADKTGYRLKGLQNNLPYTVLLVAVDDDGNLGTPTDAVVGTPVLTVDFYNEYANEGGEPVGGYCSIAAGARRPGALVMLLLCSVWVWRRRRRRRRSGWLLVAMAMLFSSDAFGQAVLHDYDDGAAMVTDDNLDRHARSPRTMALEFHLGPYLPDVDSGLANGATPHRTTFGDSTHLLYQLEIDYEVLQSFGTLAVGGSVGYFTESAKAFVAGANGSSTDTRSADDTSMRLIPFSVLVVYRFDVLAARWQVPLVPYAKAGLNYSFWRITDGNGEVATLTQGGRGSGGTLGWQASVGLALQLDGLDPGSMRELDSDSGLNHVYAFWDWSHIDASGLGMSHRLHVGDDTWSAGLLVEF
jgi:hypothetical protein